VDSIGRDQLGLLCPSGAGADKHVGRSLERILGASAGQDRVAAQRYASAEGIVGCRVRGSKLGLLDPVDAGTHKDVSRPYEGLLADCPDHRCVPIHRDRTAEVIARHCIRAS
jgi:hypothetical protein